MSQANLVLPGVNSLQAYANSRGGVLAEVYNHCITRIQPHEVSWVKSMGDASGKKALIKLHPELTSTLAFGSDDKSGLFKNALEALSSSEIEALLVTMEKDSEPGWYKAVPGLLKSLLSGVSTALFDDVFELDYEALKGVDKIAVDNALWLVFLFGLTIPSDLADGTIFDSDDK